MHENLLLAAIRENHSLHARYLVRDRYSHTGRAAHKHTRSPSKLVPHLVEHVRQIGTAILGAPAIRATGCGGQEGEAHKVLLEFCWC